MKKLLILTVALALILPACAKKAEMPQATSPPEGMASAAAMQAEASSQAAAPSGSKVLKVTLSAMKGSKISGIATFTQSESGETRVQIALAGAGSTGQLAAQLRAGTCASPGQIDLSDSWQLSNGSAEGPVLKTFDDLKTKPMIVVIIPAAGSGTLSCGQTNR